MYKVYPTLRYSVLVLRTSLVCSSSPWASGFFQERLSVFGYSSFVNKTSLEKLFAHLPQLRQFETILFFI